MLKKLFSSQLRINMASGVITTVINAVAMMAAFPIYLRFRPITKSIIPV